MLTSSMPTLTCSSVLIALLIRYAELCAWGRCVLFIEQLVPRRRRTASATCCGHVPLRRSRSMRPTDARCAPGRRGAAATAGVSSKEQPGLKGARQCGAVRRVERRGRAIALATSFRPRTSPRLQASRCSRTLALAALLGLRTPSATVTTTRRHSASAPDQRAARVLRRTSRFYERRTAPCALAIPTAGELACAIARRTGFASGAHAALRHAASRCAHAPRRALSRTSTRLPFLEKSMATQRLASS